MTNGNTYYYVVKAVNDVGSSPASNTAQATPSQAGTAPGAPTNLDAVGQVGAIVAYLGCAISGGIGSDQLPDLPRHDL